jgi:hypothetical protein
MKRNSINHKGGGENILFRDMYTSPECNEEQHITQLSDTDIFPDYTGDCIYIHNNEFIEELPIFPDTVKYISIGSNSEIIEFPKNQFPQDLIELNIEEMFQLENIYLPRNLVRLTIIHMDFTLFRSLPKSLAILKIVGCHYVDFDYDDLPKNLLSLEITLNYYTNESNIITVLKKYKRNHPDCQIETNLNFLPTKVIDLNKKKAYDIIDLEERQITKFLSDNKNFVVGKCYNQFVFIDKSRLEQEDEEELFKLSNLGFAINNAYIDYKYIKYIINSKNKFWLFEKIENYYIGNKEKSTLFTLIKIKDANSLRENLIKKFIKKTLNKKSPNSSTRKRSKSKSK